MSETGAEVEVYPEGYLEALEDCTVLAARLLKLALQSAEKESENLG